MKVKLIDKHYLYLRDEQICQFCGKALKFGKKSIDHYMPRSRGGTDDVFNLVISCKSCNCEKRNAIPSDVESRHIALFIRAVMDRKILCKSHIRMTPSDFEMAAMNTQKSYAGGMYTIFETPVMRFYVKDNLVHQIVHLHTMSDDD